MINYQKKCTHWQLTQLYLKKCNLYKNNVYFMNPQEENSEVLEYGDGGISNGDGEFLANNTSLVNGVKGPQQTPANTSSFKRTSDPQLNFLPHTDPTLEPELENKLIRLAN